MSQTVITTAFEQLKAQQAANGGVLVLDEFVFANIPNLNITDPIDRAESWPAASQIVYRQAVSKTGMVNNNAVVYSVVLGADVGDFEFNWVGLISKSSNSVCMIVHAPLQKKIKTASGQQGNVLTRSFLMEYNGASQQTQIVTPVDTWQIDFTARLSGVDERQRLENIDIYGDAGFLGDGWLVTKTSATKYAVNSGVGYVAGLRAELLANQEITAAEKPTKVWVDVCWRGTLTSAWASVSKITVASDLVNYTDNGEQHYVFAVAEIGADGAVTDLRPLDNLTARKFDDLPAVFLSRNNPFADIEADGSNAVAAALSHLGLTEILKYGAPLIGELIEWPLQLMPHEIWSDMSMEFIPYMGQTFDGQKYPLLAKLHPDLKLPTDMRGEFVRLWDNGRGVDTGRELLSAQGDAMRNIKGKTIASKYGAWLNNATGVFAMEQALYGGSIQMTTESQQSLSSVFDASRVVPTATEFRGRNVAWNAIVRAK